jgi:hypothetical protein
MAIMANVVEPSDPTGDKKPKGETEESTLEDFPILKDRIVSYFTNVSEKQLKIDLEAAGYLPPITLHKVAELIDPAVSAVLPLSETRLDLNKEEVDLSSSQEPSGESAESHAQIDKMYEEALDEIEESHFIKEEAIEVIKEESHSQNDQESVEKSEAELLDESAKSMTKVHDRKRLIGEVEDEEIL